MPEFMMPGVFIDEVRIRARSIEGVPSSTAGFVGLAERGPLGPRLVTSWSDFTRLYGERVDPDELGSFLPAAVRGFFDNGGRRAYVARVAGEGATPSSAEAGGGLTLESIGPGDLSGRLFYRVLDATGGDPDRFRLAIAFYQEPRGTSELGDLPSSDPTAADPEWLEVFDGLDWREGSPAYFGDVLARSNLIRSAVASAPTGRPIAGGWTGLAGGEDGGDVSLACYCGQAPGPTTPGTGLAALGRIDEIAVISVPDEAHSQRQAIGAQITTEVIRICEANRDRFAILQLPRDSGGDDVASIASPGNSSFAAVYHPWVRLSNPDDGSTFFAPPGGHVAGIYARTDLHRGVHKAPANEVVLGIVANDMPGGGLPLDPLIDQGQQDVLNPRGINVIRDFRAQRRGIRVWGARTLAADPDWKYVNGRRLLIYIEESISKGIEWAVFEPNAEPTWARVRQTVADFLTTAWRSGALAGQKPEDAFFVRVDRTTMTQADLDEGRLICLIGVAPSRPAEFVIFRIGQKTIESPA